MTPEEWIAANLPATQPLAPASLRNKDALIIRMGKLARSAYQTMHSLHFRKK